MHTTYIDIWRILAGIAIFLLGNKFLEDSLKKLAGRPFKLFLKKQASRKVTAISSGAIVTGILQSSSVVNMMILGFVGAGILSMQNAFAIILGSNLGTTLNSWLVAIIGFKLNIENMALPITGIAGIAMFIFNEEKKWYQWSKFIFGFSFLFVGLDFIRGGIGNLVTYTNLKVLVGYPAVVFTIVGFFLTILIQSSAATVAIVLSALFAKAIPLYDGMAIVLGAETGTTIKLMLASIGGIPDKKRVALGNFLFNAINTIIILLFLKQVYYFITGNLKIENNLIALVFFQSLVNLISIVLFLPFLKPLGRFLETRFRNNGAITLYIHKVSSNESDMATDALEKEINRFIVIVIAFCKEELGIISPADKLQEEKKFNGKSITEKYNYIKELHGNIHAYYVGVQNNVVASDITQRLDMLMSAMRNSMYAAKSIKDSYGDTEQLSNSSNDIKHQFYITTREKMTNFLILIENTLEQKNTATYINDLADLSKHVQQDYSAALSHLYTEAAYLHLSEIELSTIINFNREIYTAQDALLTAIKDFLLNTKEIQLLEEDKQPLIPVDISNS